MAWNQVQKEMNTLQTFGKKNIKKIIKIEKKLRKNWGKTNKKKTSSITGQMAVGTWPKW